MLLAEGKQLRLLEMGVQLHLIACRTDSRVHKEQLHLCNGHVRRPDMASEPLIDQSLQGPPGRHVPLVIVGGRCGTAAIDGTLWRMVVRKRPMNQIEIEIVQLQILQRLKERIAGIDRIVLIVPQFSGDP